MSLVVLIFFLGNKLHWSKYYRGITEIEEIKQQHFDQVQLINHEFVKIAHAGGGYNGKTYLNNLEAITNSYKMGFSIIEVDLHYTEDSTVVLSHDFVFNLSENFLNNKAGDTHLSLNDLMNWITSKEVVIVTDIKVDNIKVLYHISQKYPHLMDQIIPQAYTIDQISKIRKMGFKQIIFTNYLTGYPNSVIKELAKLRILFGITMPYDVNFKLLTYSSKLTDIATPIFVHTINDSTIEKKLIKRGCKGVYTDFLLPN